MGKTPTILYFFKGLRPLLCIKALPNSREVDCITATEGFCMYPMSMSWCVHKMHAGHFLPSALTASSAQPAKACRFEMPLPMMI